jgi:DNA-binding NarL/FixJ family response regulator
MRILLADDHALFRSGLRLVLEQLGPDVSVTEAGDFQEALAQSEPTLDLALLDLNMPGMDGAAGVVRIRDKAMGVPVVVISASEDAADIERLLDAGAVGYIPKSSSSQVLLSALSLVLAGGVYVPTQVLRRALPPYGSSGYSGKHPAGSALTNRQLDVLRLLVQGKPNKVIARELSLSEGTVKIHLASLYRTLNAANRTEAVMAAQRQGLLPEA